MGTNDDDEALALVLKLSVDGGGEVDNFSLLPCLLDMRIKS